MDLPPAGQVDRMPKALVIGGTGLVGRAVARRLLADGWTVSVTGRDPAHLPSDVAAAGARFVSVNREDAEALAAAAGDGADLLVDCICYTAAQAELLLPLARQATSTVMISTKAVYVDDAGRHTNSDIPPRFTGPVTEQQPTMAPGSMDYNSREGYGANKVAAEHVLLDSGLPVTVLRPSKIHGQGRGVSYRASGTSSSAPWTGGPSCCWQPVAPVRTTPRRRRTSRRSCRWWPNSPGDGSSTPRIRTHPMGSPSRARSRHWQATSGKRCCSTRPRHVTSASTPGTRCRRSSAHGARQLRARRRTRVDASDAGAPERGYRLGHGRVGHRVHRRGGRLRADLHPDPAGVRRNPTGRALSRHAIAGALKRPPAARAAARFGSASSTVADVRLAA